MIRVEKLTKVFRSGFWMRSQAALREVSLEVGKGQVYGFVGSNGAGKTTLIHLIAGVTRPSSGRVTIQCDGRWMDSREPEARSKIGYLPERPYFPEHLTGEGLLHYLASLSGVAKREVDGRIAAALSRVGLLGAGAKRIRQYSKGMLQRIGIAQAILHDPPLLLLDEPMSGLDPHGRREMRELIRSFGDRGVTVFFSTHLLHDVEAICDAVGVIEAGRVIASGPLAKLLATREGHVELDISISGAPGGPRGEAGEPWEPWADDTSILARNREGGATRLVVADLEAANRIARAALEAGRWVEGLSRARPSLEEWIESRRSGAVG